MIQKRKQKGLPKRTGKRKAIIQQHFTRAFDKKYRRVLAHEGPEAAAKWKLDRIHKSLSK